MSRPGLLFDHSGTRTEARIARESWSTQGALGPRASSLGQLFDTAAPSKIQSLPGCLSKPWPLGMGLIRPKGRSTPRTLRLGPKSPSKWVDTAGIRTLARVSRDSWSNPRALGPRTEWPVTAGRPRGPSDPRTSRPGHLVDHACPRTQARVARDSWSTTRALGSWPEAAGRAGRHRGPSDPGPSRLEQLVDPAHPWTQA